MRANSAAERNVFFDGVEAVVDGNIRVAEKRKLLLQLAFKVFLWPLHTFRLCHGINMPTV